MIHSESTKCSGFGHTKAYAGVPRWRMADAGILYALDRQPRTYIRKTRIPPRFVEPRGIASVKSAVRKTADGHQALELKQSELQPRWTPWPRPRKPPKPPTVRSNRNKPNCKPHRRVGPGQGIHRVGQSDARIQATRTANPPLTNWPAPKRRPMWPARPNRSFSPISVTNPNPHERRVGRRISSCIRVVLRTAQLRRNHPAKRRGPAEFDQRHPGFARTEEGSVGLVDREFDLADLVKRTSDRFAPQALEKKLSLTTSVPRNFPAPLRRRSGPHAASAFQLARECH